MTDNEAIISVNGLVKRLGRREVLRGLDLTVNRGTITSLIGPNGAGKTTLLRVLSTLMRPDAGRVMVNRFHLPSQADEARRSLGVVFHHPMVYGDLTARENLFFQAKLHQLANAQARIDRVLADLGLDPDRTEPVRTYSRGMQQRLALARALLTEPDILLLDEPFTGLDVQSSEVLTTRLALEAKRGCTVVFSSHDLAGVEKLASHYVVLAGGRAVAMLERANLPAGGLSSEYQRVLIGAGSRL